LKRVIKVDRRIVLLPGGLAFVIALSFIATTAQAGLAITQGHQIGIKGQIYGQGSNEKTGDDQLEKESFSEKDLGAACLGNEKLEKGQAVIITLFDACSDPNDNEIQIVRTDPFAVLETIGDIDFDDDLIIATEKKGVVTTLTVPAEVDVECAEGDIVFSAGAIATARVDELGCVQTVKVQNATGDGMIFGESVLIDKAKIDAKKPNPSFVIVP
jgi:hypothetical protein